MAITPQFGRETGTKQDFQMLHAHIEHRGRNGHTYFMKCGTLKMSTHYI